MMDSRRGPAVLPLLLAVTGVVLGVLLLVPPIAQDPAYHRFADMRTLLGVPHFWNVASNAPFVVVGAAGLLLSWQAARRGTRPSAAEWLFCLGILAVGPGSAWYHLAPDNGTLFWDRLPMTIGFMALFAALLGDTVGPAWERRGLWPLLAIGVLSVLYWSATERAGAGDLRPYALVQFLPLLLIPLLVALFGCRRYRMRYLWLALVGYALAKVAEHADTWVYSLTGGISGHALKHLLAALACGFVVLLFCDPKVPAVPSVDGARPS